MRLGDNFKKSYNSNNYCCIRMHVLRIISIGYILTVSFSPHASFAADDRRSSRGNKTHCPPLKQRKSEEVGCYKTDMGDHKIPCEVTELNSQIVKKCKWPYTRGEPNVTYTCFDDGWDPQYDTCQSDCSLSPTNKEYPWIAAIYDAYKNFKCAGTIISPYHVVTASTCCERIHYNYNEASRGDSQYCAKIFVGIRYNRTIAEIEYAQVRQIKRSHMPEPLILDKEFLILLEVDKEFDFNNDVVPACLDWYLRREPLDFIEGNEATAPGWVYNGHTNEFILCKEPHQIQYWSRRTCLENTPHSALKYGAHMFCGSLLNNHSDCTNVTGAGLYFKSKPQRYYLRGVTSNFLPNVNATRMVFIKVSPFLGWLWEKVRSHPSIDPFPSYLPWTTDISEIRSTGCTLPEHVENGRFRFLLSTTYKVNSWVPSSTRILLDCLFSDKVTLVNILCSKGQWIPSINGLRCRSACGHKTIGSNNIITNSGDTVKDEYPWVAAIYRMGELVCSGTLITKLFVLSAAHCVSNSLGKPRNKLYFTVQLGKYHRNYTALEPTTQSRQVRSVTMYKDYKGRLNKYQHDIAIIELDSEIELTHAVQPICVDWDDQYEDSDFIDGNYGVVTGWNIRETGSNTDVLKHLAVPFVSKKICVQNLSEDLSSEFREPLSICAGYANGAKNMCTGKMGAGLYFKSTHNHYYIRGIVKLNGGCEGNRYELYTKISAYLPWIESKIKREGNLVNYKDGIYIGEGLN